MEGEGLTADDLPLVISLRERRPCHSQFKIMGLDDTELASAFRRFKELADSRKAVTLYDVFEQVAV